MTDEWLTDEQLETLRHNLVKVYTGQPVEKIDTLQEIAAIEELQEARAEIAALKAENKVLRDGAPKFIITEGKHV